MSIEFCLPVKDEEKILEANSRRLADYIDRLGINDWRIVIIVNGSVDRSNEIANSLVAENSLRFKSVFFHQGGKGQAIREYFKTSQADVMVFMDIDLAVDLGDLPKLLQPIQSGKADLVLGSRLMSGSRTNRSAWRSLTSRCYNQLSRLVLGHKLSDLQCGFKAIRRHQYTLVEPYLRDKKWFFDTELVIIARKLGLKIIETPVAWQENRYDERKSKVSVFRDAWSFVSSLVNLRRRLKDIKQR